MVKHKKRIKCKKCKGKNVVGIEYAFFMEHHYNGTSEYRCRDCGYRWGRWSEKELKNKETEAPPKEAEL